MSKTFRRGGVCFAAAAGALLLAAAAGLADLVRPGECIDLAGTTVAARPVLAQTVVRDELVPFEIYDAAGTLVFAGELQQRVARSNVRGTLIFSFRIRDTDPALDGSIVGVYWTGFTEGPTAFMTDVDYRLDGLGDVGPPAACRSDDGDALYFDFANAPVTPGDESYFVFALTDTTKHAREGTITLINQDFSVVTLPCYAPRVVP